MPWLKPLVSFGRYLVAVAGWRLYKTTPKCRVMSLNRAARRCSCSRSKHRYSHSRRRGRYSRSHCYQPAGANGYGVFYRDAKLTLFSLTASRYLQLVAVLPQNVSPPARKREREQPPVGRFSLCRFFARRRSALCVTSLYVPSNTIAPLKASRTPKCAFAFEASKFAYTQARP